MTMMPTSRCHESWRNEQFLGHFQSNSDSSRPRIRNAIIIALAFGVALPVAAEPFVCPNVVTLDITLTNSPNSDPCNNDGTINILDGGILNNTGRLNNNHSVFTFSGGTFNNAGTFDNAGLFDNSGTLNNQPGGLFTNYGTLNNKSFIDNDGTIMNFGTMNTDIDRWRRFGQ